MTTLFHPALMATIHDLSAPDLRTSKRVARTLAEVSPNLTLSDLSAVSLANPVPRADTPDLVQDLQAIVRSRYGFFYSKEEYGYSITFKIPAGVSSEEFIQWASDSTPTKFASYKVISDTSPLHNSVSHLRSKKDRVITLAILTELAGHLKMEQLEALQGKGLRPAREVDLCLGAAIYRLAFGFPAERTQIGTCDDPGDILNGYATRLSDGFCYLMNDRQHRHGPAGLDYVQLTKDLPHFWDDILIVGSPE